MLFNQGRTKEGKERERGEATGCIISESNNNRFIANLERHNFADDLPSKRPLIPLHMPEGIQRHFVEYFARSVSKIIIW